MLARTLSAVDGHVEVLHDGKVKRGKRNSSDGMPFWDAWRFMTPCPYMFASAPDGIFYMM